MKLILEATVQVQTAVVLTVRLVSKINTIARMALQRYARWQFSHGQCAICNGISGNFALFPWLTYVKVNNVGLESQLDCQ